MTTPPPAGPAPERVCRCHSSHVYASLQRCPRCGHRSLDPGIGCERRKCGYEEPEAGTVPSEGGRDGVR